MKRYMTYRYNQKIEEVEVIRETPAFIYVPNKYRKSGEVREAKRGQYTNYFDTWDEARDFLIEQAEGEVAAAMCALEVANGKLSNIKGMKKP